MPQLTVKYKNKRTLEALQNFAKYFDYEILLPKSKEKKQKKTMLQGVTIIAGDSSVNTDELNDIFTGKNIEPSNLRKEAWQRKK